MRIGAAALLWDAGCVCLDWEAAGSKDVLITVFMAMGFCFVPSRSCFDRDLSFIQSSGETLQKIFSGRRNTPGSSWTTTSMWPRAKYSLSAWKEPPQISATTSWTATFTRRNWGTKRPFTGQCERYSSKNSLGWSFHCSFCFITWKSG